MIPFLYDLILITFFSQFQVDVYNQENELVNTITARRRRRLAGTYTWKISFKVVEATAEDMAQYEAAIESDSFTDEVETNVGIEVTVEEVSGVVEVQEEVTQAEEEEEEKKTGATSAASGTIFIIIGAVVACMAVTSMTIFCRRKETQQEIYQGGDLELASGDVAISTLTISNVKDGTKGSSGVLSFKSGSSSGVMLESGAATASRTPAGTSLDAHLRTSPNVDLVPRLAGTSLDDVGSRSVEL